MEALTNLSTPIMMGILLGGLYALIALGLSLVFGVVKLINLAHGDLVITGSYIAYAAFTALGMDPVVSLVFGIPILFVVGFLIQRYLLNKAFAISMEAPLIITFGISLILQSTNQMMFSPMSRGLSTAYSMGSLTIGGYIIPRIYLIDFVVGIIVMFALREFLKRTYLGKAITAASQDAKAAQLMGINTTRTYAFAFAIAMIFAAIGGVFLGLTFPFTPVSGVQFLIIAFGVVILGGLGNILGTFLGGLIMGLAQTLGGYFFGVMAQMLIAYIVVLIVLAVRPQGIFGR